VIVLSRGLCEVPIDVLHVPIEKGMDWSIGATVDIRVVMRGVFGGTRSRRMATENDGLAWSHISKIYSKAAEQLTQ
jgi:hypothetical protein